MQPQPRITVPDHMQGMACAFSVAYAYRLTIGILVRELAKHHGYELGSWLDEIEAECLRRVKTTGTNAPTIVLEAAMLRDAATAVRTVFGDVRDIIESEQSELPFEETP